MLVNVTSGTTSLEKPGPQPLLTAIVESPTRMMRTGGRGAGVCAKAEAAVSNIMAEKKICFRMVGGTERTSIRLRNGVKSGIDGSKAKSSSVFLRKSDSDDPLYERGFCVCVGFSVEAMLFGEALLEFRILRCNIRVTSQVVTEC